MRVLIRVTFMLFVGLLIWMMPGFATRLERHVVCRDVQPFSPYEPIGITTRISTMDTKVYSWVRLNNVRGPHTVRWVWVNPKQVDWASYEVQIPSGSWDWYVVWCYIYLDPGAEGFLTGEWRIFVFLDCRPLEQARFTLTAAWVDEGEPNSVPSAAQRIKVPGQVRGFTSTEDHDWYVVTLSGTGTWYLTVNTWWSRPQAMATVFHDASLKKKIPFYYMRKDSGGFIWNECFVLTAPGTYYVQVRGGTLNSEEYILSVQRNQPWWVEK